MEKSMTQHKRGEGIEISIKLPCCFIPPGQTFGQPPTVAVAGAKQTCLLAIDAKNFAAAAA